MAENRTRINCLEGTNPSTGWEFVSILLAPSRELQLHFCLLLVFLVHYAIFCFRYYLYC
jgi:hypothetical protein